MRLNSMISLGLVLTSFCSVPALGDTKRCKVLRVQAEAYGETHAAGRTLLDCDGDERWARMENVRGILDDHRAVTRIHNQNMLIILNTALVHERSVVARIGRSSVLESVSLEVD